MILNLWRLRREAKIAKAAAVWVARCDRGLSLSEAAALRNWKDEDPRHAIEMVRATNLWRECDSIAQVSAFTYANGISSKSWWSYSPILTFSALAATLLLVGAGGFWFVNRPNFSKNSAVTYRIIPSAAKKLRLDDGSLVELRGNSEVLSEYTVRERKVTLVRGEANFTVMKNADRPFLVSAGGVIVRAVGTAFVVKIDAAAVNILVTEGKVKLLAAHAPTLDISAPEAFLVSGQSAQVACGPVFTTALTVAVNEISREEMDRALNWQSTRFVFNHTPLAQVVEVFNSYNAERHGPILSLGDPSLGRQLLGGTFHAENVAGFVRLLSQTGGIHATFASGGEIILWPNR